MLWLWRKEIVIFEGFEGIWCPFRLDSVVKSPAWVSITIYGTHRALSSGALTWAGWPQSQAGFLCSAGLSAPLQSTEHLLLKSRAELISGAQGTASSAGWGDTAEQELGSLSQHSWHSTKSSPDLGTPPVTWAVTSPGHYPAEIFFPRSAEDIFCQSSCTGWARISLLALVTKLH